MSVRATCFLDGRVVDLIISPRPDSDTAAILDEIHGHCGRGVLECREHDDEERLASFRDRHGRVHEAWCYLQKRRDAWVICHHPNQRGIQLDDHVLVGMSDQHRWQQDYYSRAAQDAGHQVQWEYSTNTGVRVDVLLRGTVDIGIEVQHSDLSAPKARNRHRKAGAAGITSIWSADRADPPFAFKVPHVETNQLPHSAVPRGQWTVTTGPRILRSVTCSARNSDLLPRCAKPRARNWCGGKHPVWEPKPGVVVDDIAELAPAGGLVVLDTGARQGTILVEQADRNRYLSDFAAGLQPIPQPRSPGEPCGYRPEITASSDSVLGRLLKAGLSEARIVEHLRHGRIRINGRVVRNLHDPAGPGSRIVFGSGVDRA